MGFIKTLGILIAIPVFGFILSIWVLSDINKELSKNGDNYTVGQVCTPEIISKVRELKAFCDEVEPILWMQTASIISAAIAALLLLSFIFFASVAGKSRAKVARIFPPLVSVTLLVLSALVIVQGAILTYGAYLAESYSIQRVHFFLIGALGLGALIGGLSLIGATFKLAKKQTHSVLGVKLDPNSHPKLFLLIKQISEKLGAKNPEHVVVGLEPNFYVTSADIEIIGGGTTTLKGETLYLSMPLARILTIEELKGIIGHELGHFRGKDTYYSLKFSPVYSGLTHAITGMGKLGDNIATLPAFFVISYVMDVFHKNISSISREREYEADKAAGEVAEPKALATSLLKIGLYADAWNNLEGKVIKRMQEGKLTRNLSQLFSSIVKYDINKDSIPKIIESIGQQTISHPTDSHPPTAKRISELGLNINDIEQDLLISPDHTCIDLFENPKIIEEELTILRQRYFVSLGVKIPEESNTNFAATIIAAFGAHMVVADGKIESEEIDAAEAMGLSLSDKFDYIEFREYCLHPDTIPSIEELLEATKSTDDDIKNMVLNYLKNISSSDGDIGEGEIKLLNRVSTAFQVQMQ